MGGAGLGWAGGAGRGSTQRHLCFRDVSQTTGSCVSPKELFSLKAQLELPGDQVRRKGGRRSHVPLSGARVCLVLEAQCAWSPQWALTGWARSRGTHTAREEKRGRGRALGFRIKFVSDVWETPPGVAQKNNL